MARGINAVAVSGNVTADIKFGQTDQGFQFCSFTLISEKKDRKKRTIVRVNIYVPGLVDVCHDRLQEGCYVVVVGEMMNPDRMLGCEVRCHEIVFTERREA